MGCAIVERRTASTTARLIVERVTLNLNHYPLRQIAGP
jgi:hypothetical protein